MSYIFQTNPGVQVVIQSMPSVAGSPSMLIYTKGGGNLFPNLVNDLIAEPGLYHNGNAIAAANFSTKACDKLSVNVTTKKVYSPETQKGLFDIEYPVASPVIGKANYFWSSVYCTPVGVYTVRVTPGLWDFTFSREILQFSTNDVNIVPRVGDFIFFNEVPYGNEDYVNGDPSSRLKMYTGMECIQAKILEVFVFSGTGKDILYQVTLDKSIKFKDSDRYSVVLFNRENTDIQKELFYDTFELIEVNRQQLLGDPYNNTSLVTKPKGRNNYLYYRGNEALGYKNLLNNIVNSKDTPLIILDINDELKDRFSTTGNTYDANGLPLDNNFELHIPGVLINDNVYVGEESTIDADGNVLENIFVFSSNIITDPAVGKYSGLYLKSDVNFKNRYGFVFFDLRILVIDHSEFATALSYNSNRNYTVPAPYFTPGSGNSLPNLGVGINLDVTGATNSSPIIIKTATPHKLQRGAKVFISGVQGNTAANGEWFVDLVYTDQSNRFTFELWQQLPQYNLDGTRVIPTSGTSVTGNGTFINNGIGSSGKVIGALPSYSFFYTYRVRTKHYANVAPYAEITNFNFTKGGSVDNSEGSLLINIPKFNWAKGYGSLSNFDKGFNILSTTDDVGYGVDVIIGEYDRNVNDPINPNKITGIKNVVVIPMSELTEPFFGSPFTGLSLEIKKVQDFNRVVDSSTNFGFNYFYDLLNNYKLYDYNANVLSETLLTGNGKWFVGNVCYRSMAEMYRSVLDVYIPADKWNDSTNPSYKPSENEFIKDKFISEVAIIMDGDDTNKPVIYTKISPVIKKNNLLDIKVSLSIDF